MDRRQITNEVNNANPPLLIKKLGRNLVASTSSSNLEVIQQMLAH